MQSPLSRAGANAPTSTSEPTTSQPGGYASGARVLSIGIASTGVFTFLYLAFASHVLGKAAYARISLCWAIMYVILSVIYRPIEQLLSRTIADRRARGLHGHPLRVAATIQSGFAATYLVAALVLHRQIEQGMFDGSQALYWVLVVGVLAYAASYFARGWLAGHQRFELYGGLVFLESVSRFLFALGVALGIASGQGAVALGMAVAPFASLSVIPFAFSRIRRQTESGAATGTSVRGAAGELPRKADEKLRVPAAQQLRAEAVIADIGPEGPAHAQIEAGGLAVRRDTGFAFSVVGIMLAEQTLMNAGVLIIAATSGGSITSGLTGFVFNVLLIVRAPLQLFQAIQTAILPHLAGLEAKESDAEFHHAVRVTVLAIAAFAGAVAVGLLAVGPPVMTAVLGSHGFTYARWGLALVGVAMGFHLVSGTLNQAALARGRAALACIAWLAAGALFVAFVAAPTIGNEVTRVEVGYSASTLLLCALLSGIYRLGSRAALPLGWGPSRRRI